MPLGLGLGISKIKSLISGLRVRFQGNATITAALDGILRDLSADFVSDGTVTAALEAIKLLDVDFSGTGTVTGELLDFTGLLDDYPNAAAAYSVRLLSSTYSGALVRIRRSSDNAEKDFLPDSNNELSMSSESVVGSQTLSNFVGANNGFVVTWYDQSGNANDATQSTASAQPQIINAGSLISENGKAILDCSPSGCYLSCPINSTDEYWIFSTLRNSTVKSIFSGTSSGQDFNLAAESGSTSTGINSNLTINSIKLNGAIYNLNTRGDLYTITSNQTLLYENVDYNFADSDFILGYRDGAGWNPYSMQEVIFYDTTQSSNVSNIETNINDYFSIY